MTGSTSTRKTASQSAKLGPKDFVSRLTEAGEDTLKRLSELPGGQRAVSAFNDLKSQVDDLGKKVRGIDALEARVTKLEKELAALKKGSSSTARRTTARKPSS